MIKYDINKYNDAKENMKILIDVLTCDKLQLKKMSYVKLYSKFYYMFLYHNKHFINEWFKMLFKELFNNLKPLTNVNTSCDILLYGLNNDYYDKEKYINLCNNINIKIENLYKIINKILLYKLNTDIIETHIIKFLIIR